MAKEFALEHFESSKLIAHGDDMDTRLVGIVQVRRRLLEMAAGSPDISGVTA